MIEVYKAPDGTQRKWTHADSQEPRAACYDCGKPYAEMGDCVVSNELWETINPTMHKGAGLLCANCIIDRLRFLGICNGVVAKLFAA
jgi:hypothetical protein